jgi:3-isopropylmalate/(R)-2-methylmalate dehydratase small subunit
MPKFEKFTSTAVYLPLDNVDTDQIIPARYLKVTDKANLADGLFADWRYLADGSSNIDFVINQANSQGAQILVAGSNFGCGSSREHAPWALVGFGFRAVVARSFADIFRGNALKNTLLPVQLEGTAYRSLAELLEDNPGMAITIDLAQQTVSSPHGTSWWFPIDSFSKTCLINGRDELGYLLSFEKQIVEYESRR